MKPLPIFASLMMLLGGYAIFPASAENLLSGQEPQSFITITGKVQDAVTGKAMAFASISLKNSAISNVTNSDGIFILKIPLDRLEDSDSVIVSYMGYRNKTESAKDFRKGKVMKIALQPSSFNIKALHIYPNDPDAIFDIVFSRSNVMKNFPSKPEGMQGFYREIISKGRKYGTVTEAVLDISKASYSNYVANDNAAILLGRSSHKFSINDTVMMAMEGGPLANLSLDIVKFPFIGTTLQAAHDFYRFTFGNPVEIDGRNIVVIRFRQKDSTEALYSGELYVDKETLALVKASFRMNVDYSSDSWREFVRYMPPKVSVKAERADFLVNYKVVGDRMRFDYSRVELDFSVKYVGKWLRNKYSAVSELAITDYDKPSALRIPVGQRIRMKDNLGRKVKDFSNPDFWGDYNIIEPDASLQSVLKKVVRQLRRQEND